jgi:hypothetical protein
LILINRGDRGCCLNARRAQSARTEWEVNAMDTPASSPPGQPERVPVMQRVLDNPFLLLFLGVTIPAVLYVIWGVMEIIQIPLAR